MIDNGRFNHSDVREIWSDYPKELHNWLLKLTEVFELTFPLPDEKVSLVPCLLPPLEPKVYAALHLISRAVKSIL